MFSDQSSHQTMLQCLLNTQPTLLTRWNWLDVIFYYLDHIYFIKHCYKLNSMLNFLNYRVEGSLVLVLCTNVLLQRILMHLPLKMRWNHFFICLIFKFLRCSIVFPTISRSIGWSDTRIVRKASMHWHLTFLLNLLMRISLAFML